MRMVHWIKYAVIMLGMLSYNNLAAAPFMATGQTLEQSIQKEPVVRKKIFRPIKIWRRNIWFWIAWCAGISTTIFLIFYLSYKLNADLDLGKQEGEIIIFSLAGIMFVTGILAGLLLLSIPIVYLIRALRTIKPKDKFGRCYEF